MNRLFSDVVVVTRPDTARSRCVFEFFPVVCVMHGARARRHGARARRPGATQETNPRGVEVGEVHLTKVSDPPPVPAPPPSSQQAHYCMMKPGWGARRPWGLWGRAGGYWDGYWDRYWLG